MKRIPTVLIVLLFASTMHAQGWRGNGRLQGNVVDQKTGQPVKDAKVTLRHAREGGGPEVTTNDKGRWSVLGIGSGTWDIDVEAAGYVTKKISLPFRETDRVPPMKIELEPAPVEEPQPASEPAPETVSVGGVAVTPEIVQAIESGNALLKDKKYKEAAEQYEKAYPTLSSNINLKVALARAYYGAGDLKKSIVLLEEAYKADPANVQNALLLGSILLEDGNLERGRQVIEGLPAEAMNDPTAMINVGILLMNKKQPALARDYFTKAIAIDGARAEAYYFRGLATIQAGKAKDAKADLEKTIALAPDSSEAKEAADLLKSIK